VGKRSGEIAIPAAFLTHFYHKPPNWWIFWWRTFADLSANNGEITYSQSAICSWLNVSRSTLRRVVEFGTEFNADEQQVDSTRTDTAIVADKVVKPSLTRVNAPERRKSNALFAQMIAAYDVWIRETTGFPAKIDGAQGKAMKQIIQYLGLAIKEAETTDNTDVALEIGTLKAWNLILSNWLELDQFYQDQIKLTQINSNLQLIMTFMRKSRKSKPDNRRSKIDNELNKYLNKLDHDGN
tara:strand:- start:2694 stop:3410 length:717 start_codon:yes stop_codon:yes gene_type:complete